MLRLCLKSRQANAKGLYPGCDGNTLKMRDSLLDTDWTKTRDTRSYSLGSGDSRRIRASEKATSFSLSLASPNACNAILNPIAMFAGLEDARNAVEIGISAGIIEDND